MKDTEAKTSPNWILIVVIVLGAIAAVWGISLLIATPKATPPPPGGIPVSAEAVKQGDIDITIDALGAVTPVATVTVTSRVGGELKEVRYQEGQMVKKQDVLAIIDPGPYQAMLLQAQGQLARDQAQLKNAQLDLSRYQSAYQDHAIPEQQMATQEALVEQDSGVVKLDEGNLQAAQINVDYTTITSPIDGRVGLRGVDPGNIVVANGSTALATITQLQPITVIFNLAEDDLGRVAAETNAGQTLKVYALDRDQSKQLAEGTLLTLDNQINPTTGTVRARATFANRKNELFPNQFVNARLIVKTLTKVNLVPTAAIQRNSDAAFVYVIQGDNTVLSVNVKIAATEGDMSAVSGVTPGQKLVTDGFDKLQNGVKIIVRRPQGRPAPAAPAE